MYKTHNLVFQAQIQDHHGLQLTRYGVFAGNNKDRMHTVSCYHFCFLLHWPGEAIHMWPHHITPCSMFYYNHNCFAFHLSRLQKVPSRVKILETWTRPALMGAVFAMAWFNSLMSSILIQNDPSLHFTCPGCRRFQAKSRSWRRGQGLN